MEIPILLIAIFFTTVHGLEYDGLKKKAAFMESGMDTSVNPCEDFWTYANGRFRNDLSNEYLKDVKRVLSSTSSGKNESIIDKARKHYTFCITDPLQFFYELYHVETRNQNLQLQLKIFEIRLHKKLYMEDEKEYLNLLQYGYHLLFAYGGSDFEKFIEKIILSNVVYLDIKPISIRSLENDVIFHTNLTEFEDFLNGVFGEKMDLNGFIAAVFPIPNENQTHYREHILHALFASLWSLQSVPHYPSCEEYILSNYPMILTKMLLDDIGYDNVNKLEALFRSDLDLLLKSYELEFKYGTLFSTRPTTELLERLGNNTFYGIKHDIFEDSQFEKYFANTTFATPHQNRWMNNVKPLIKAAYGKPIDYYLTQDIKPNAYHAGPTRWNSFSMAFFKAPFYDLSYPPVLRWSGLGYAAGHELGHEYDTDLDKEKLDCLFTFFQDQCDPQRPELCIDPENNQGENNADILGAQMAYLAYKRDSSINGVGQRPRGNLLDPLTDDQLFFLNLAQTMSLFSGWEGYTHIDPHSPTSVRVWGALAGLPAFSSAFNCPVGSYYNKVDVCKLNSN